MNGIRLEISPNEAFKPVNGYVVIEIDKKYDDIVSHKLGIKTDTTFRPLHHITISGKVIGVPDTPDKEYAYQIDDMFPPTKNMNTGDQITERFKKYPDYALTDFVILATLKTYRPTQYSKRIQSYFNQKVNVKLGDKIYFHYLTVDPENFMGRNEKGKLVYKVQYSQIFCKTKTLGGFKALNAYAIVDKIDNDMGFKPISAGMGQKVMARTRKVMDPKGRLVDMVVGIDMKRMTHHGRIIELSHDLQADRMRNEVRNGDYIAFTALSEFENKIEDKTYYVMKSWDIVARKNIKSEWEGVNDMCVIEPIKPEVRAFTALKAVDLPKVTKGKITSVGKKVINFSPGDVVYFNPEARSVITEDLIAVPDRHIPIKLAK